VNERNVVVSEIAPRAEGGLELGVALFGPFDPSCDSVLCLHEPVITFLRVVVFSHYGNEVLSTTRMGGERIRKRVKE